MSHTGRTPAKSALALGALGVVYGDIGTSPLYAFRESFEARPDVMPDHANILGVLSLITWSLIVVISVKYLSLVMRADADGEGGILALTSLVPRSGDYHGKGLRRATILIGVFGTALLYGDGMITPAISVLSAVEGLSVVTPAFDPLIIPLACLILVGLFAFQSRGTAAVGAVFGPVMVVWFLVLSVLGVLAITKNTEVIAAINPLHGASFFLRNGFSGLLVLGSVFLVVTGGEALYADMGHFGREPIRKAWFVLVLPALLLNYYGQGALLLANPGAVENPFFRLAPGWALIPLVLLATMATVIASQALISGAFSLTVQAIHMGYMPRLRVHHTSDSQIGQVYIPSINYTLMVACLALVLAFKSSANLAAAYGVAVTATMMVTTLLFGVVAREQFGWSKSTVLAMTVAFLVIDLGFFIANIFKIPDGGWFPLVVGVVVFTIMTTWRRGRNLLSRRLRKGGLSTKVFLRDLGTEVRVPGTAVYLAGVPDTVPPSLLANLRHNNALHEAILLLHIDITDSPHVSAVKRETITKLAHGFVDVRLRYGFRDRLDVPEALRAHVAPKLDIDFDDLTYVVGRETIVNVDHEALPLWRGKLFAALTRNAVDVAKTFHLPTERVLEIGSSIEL